ncbi:hypothetical protein PIB30_088527 [Stylosanthes scabra]|uniref:FAR1 domain-containing protein n=1 Tax=Stylosanthes scabra TaxID=79078 RepID=A0ABU6RTY8_9FABA|nr:hypothetical protein [Stylosanthes scabra]
MGSYNGLVFNSIGSEFYTRGTPIGRANGEFCSFVLHVLLKFYQDLNSIDEVGQLDDHFEDLNSIDKVGQLDNHFEDLNSINKVQQLEDQTEFLFNVDEEHVPKVGMTFKSTEASEFYKEYAKRAGFSSKIRNSQRNKETGAIKNQLFTCKREGKIDLTSLSRERRTPCPRQIVRQGCSFISIS